MKLTKAEILHIANLARLNLEEAEVETFRGQLSAILDHMAKLQEVIVAAGEEHEKPASNITQLRTDGVGQSLPPQELLRNAGASEKQQFLIPPVFE